MELGPALASISGSSSISLVLGPQSRGAMLGALVATSLHVGLVEARTDPARAADSDAWLTRTTPPDYRDRHLTLGCRRNLIRAGDRVLFVDDWIETGGQALASKALVEAAGATWCGAVVLVDGLSDARLRRDLQVRSVLHIREL
jgi:adenine phosphoribosyltransferase